MDRKKIERIIAREGLILLGIIAIGTSFIYLANVIRNKQLLPVYLLEFDNGKKYKAVLNPNEDYRIVATDKELNELAENIKKRENLPLDLKLKSFKLISGKRTDFIWIEQRVENFRKLGVIILFLTYPLYLLICFFIWAVKVLREK